MIDPITKYMLEQSDAEIEKSVAKAEKMGSKLKGETEKTLSQMGSAGAEE